MSGLGVFRASLSDPSRKIHNFKVACIFHSKAAQLSESQGVRIRGDCWEFRPSQ